VSYVLAIATRAGVRVRPTAAWLVFGKRLLSGRPDADFELRLARLQALRTEHPQVRTLILGGRSADDSRSEARAGAEYLEVLAGRKLEDIQLEERSRDTLENLRNAMRALQGSPASLPVTLISNRYHLARCGLLARHLGLHSQLCAAEAHWRWSGQGLLRVCSEAGYICWFAIGKRWIKLIGSERMLSRIS
jgi:uncharacterized SAM-binding protein YcdF (DUF218 family)